VEYQSEAVFRVEVLKRGPSLQRRGAENTEKAQRRAPGIKRRKHFDFEMFYDLNERAAFDLSFDGRTVAGEAVLGSVV
jgi:hypothetical protein